MRAIVYFLLIFFFLPWRSVAQADYNFFISNSGNDANPGTSKSLPKKTITGTAPILTNYATPNRAVSVGLKAGSVFEDALEPTYSIKIGSYEDDNSKKSDFAILNGTDIYDSGWTRTDSTVNIFEQDIALSGFAGHSNSGIGAYSYVYVVEIDKSLEKKAPYTSRKLLKFVNSLSLADRTPGSFYEPLTYDENTKRVFIHTSDGSSPNSNSKYRYEVVARAKAIKSTWYPNNRFENLWVRGYGDGAGSISGGDNSYYNKIIFGPGAPIHHVNVRSGIINNSLFLPGPKNTNGYAVVFYDTEGFGRHNKISNSIFLDIPYPMYSHTSGSGTWYGALELDNVKAFVDKPEGILFLSVSNVDSIILNNVYADGFDVGYSYLPNYAKINNSCFKDVTTGIYATPWNSAATINNVFIKAKANNKKVTGIRMPGGSFLNLTNSIIHLVNTASNQENADVLGSFVERSAYAGTFTFSKGNIFIADVGAKQSVFAALTNTDKGIETSTDIWSNNVYILLKGKIFWTVTNTATNNNSSEVRSFSEWKRQSGQDQNSLFFDLRNDPRGLKAIFVDPDNGNYELANTMEANQIRALKAGMTDPITCFLKKPTYEEAADIIQNNKDFSFNYCRNPCAETTIKVSSQFTSSILSKREVKLQWIVGEQQNIGHFEIERTTGAGIYQKMNTTQVATDSVYSFIDNDIQSNLEYNYRLVVVAKNGDKCYSALQYIKIVENDLQEIEIYPNPSPGKIRVSLNPYQGTAHCTVFNSFGQVVLVKEADLQYGRPLLLDFSDRSKGAYWLKLETSKGSFMQRFILQ